MKIFPHVSLHQLPVQILHIRVVSGAEIFFYRHGGGRRHALSIWHPGVLMATLRVQNVSEEISELLRTRARSNRRSISAETMSLLEQELPTLTKVRRRAASHRRIVRLRSRYSEPPDRGR